LKVKNNLKISDELNEQQQQRKFHKHPWTNKDFCEKYKFELNNQLNLIDIIWKKIVANLQVIIWTILGIQYYCYYKKQFRVLQKFNIMRIRTEKIVKIENLYSKKKRVLERYSKKIKFNPNDNLNEMSRLSEFYT
jgi:hypothetical protein